jgi:hypothetical protein
MTTSCLSTLPAPSLFSFSPETNTFLTGKINVLFGATVACCAAGLAYVLYNFYQAYQFSMHTSFGLDDHSKLVKCKALLSEADKKVFAPKKTGEKAIGLKDVLQLLQPCETMLDSIPDSFQSDKEKLLHDLVIQYSREEPEHAYSIAQRLTSSESLLDATSWIRRSDSAFNKGKLNSLYEKAYQAREREQKDVDKRLSPDSKSQGIDLPLKYAKATRTRENINFSLTLATGFHTVGNSQHAEECFGNAQQLALTIEIPLEQMRALCEISFYLHQTQDNSSAKSSIDSATKLLCEIQEKDLIEARVALANAYYWVKNFEEMYQELQKVIELFEANFSTRNPYPFESLIDMIDSAKKYEKHQKALSDVKFDTLIKQARVLIQSSSAKIQTTDTKKPVKSENNRITVPTAQSGSPSPKKIPANADQKKQDAYSQVIQLVRSTEHMFGGEQIIPQLKAAEELLPQLSNQQWRTALAEIAKGYSKVDGQKSLAILADMKNDQAKICLIKATVTAVGLAALRFCPLASPVIFLGVGAYTWHTW